jgi:hypothetical protein
MKTPGDRYRKQSLKIELNTHSEREIEVFAAPIKSERAYFENIAPPGEAARLRKRKIPRFFLASPMMSWMS